MIDEDAVKKAVAQWPSLTDEKLDKIAALLRAGSRNVKRDRPSAGAA